MLVVRRALRAIQPFVAALGAVPVVVSLAVMGGCEVFDPSLVELPACTGRRPPAAPSVADGSDGERYVLVLRDIVIDQRAEDGAPPESAPWRTTGFNLDSMCTTANDLTTECVPAREGASVQVDGDDGIDNTFGNSFFPILNLVQSGIEGDLVASQAAGVGALVIMISDWNGERDDPRVTVAIAQSVFGSPGVGGEAPELLVVGSNATLSDGTTPAPPPAWDGEDYFWVRDDNFLGGDLDMPAVQINHAYVRDGQLVVFVPNGTEFKLIGTGFGATVRMTGMIAMGELYDTLIMGVTDPPPRITVAGRWGLNHILATSENVGICPGSAAFRTLMQTLTGMCDVQLQPATPADTSLPCDALSIATTFDAYVGHVGGIAVGQPLPNPCSDP
ncbi:MAG: hypothetical protein R3B40_16415 [Polyangiales bacterium]|nr:hypothetical protein [Sandaracinaceae bacterium]